MFEAVRRGDLIPEKFQQRIIDGVSASLLANDLPCLLRAPTASGKTLMLGRITERVSEPLNIMWFWFVPYGFLVSQTINSLFDNCAGLLPLALASERRSDHHAGDVLVGSLQTVAIGDREGRKIFRIDDTGLPSLQRIVARARSRGVKIGIVIDEAHIGVASETEFGRFCKALMPDRVLLASATPRDTKLNAFTKASGYDQYVTFSVSRDDVVDAGLNKRYIEAHVFKIDTTWDGITDVKRTALRQAWLQNKMLKERLTFLGVQAEPLMLVQIENGASGAEIATFLSSECEVDPATIGEHTTDSPDPKMMASIANDATKKVLIFKESAGTGFDAPRAFVLVSMKNVIDADFAMQFLGRIMRVERGVRAKLLASPATFDPALDTGYLYLANIEAQLGFEKAVAALELITTEADGTVEHLRQMVGKDGSIVITNRPERQLGLRLRISESALGAPAASETSQDKEGEFAGTLIDFITAPTSTPQTPRQSRLRLFDETYDDENALEKSARDMGLGLYRLRKNAPHLPESLETEMRPEIGDLLTVARSIAGHLNYDRQHVQKAVTIALRGTTAIERITELTQHDFREQEIRAIFDPDLLARQSAAILRSLPQMEEADRRELLSTLSARIEPEVETVLQIFEDKDRPKGPDLVRLVRNVTNLIVKSNAAELSEAYHRAMSDAVRVSSASSLPDALLFPQALPLLKSRRNVYGVFPPLVADGRVMNTQIYADERRLLESATYLPVRLRDNQNVSLAYCDSTWWSNREEDRFARSVDRADFVYWWHRNPPRKPYSVAVVRADTSGSFYPDFVICLATFAGDSPRVRLVETKESLKDAVRKMKRVPKYYGKVVFITKDGERYRIVTDNGQLGATVDDDLDSLRDELRQTAID